MFRRGPVVAVKVSEALDRDVGTTSSHGAGAKHCQHFRTFLHFLRISDGHAASWSSRL